jgi:hypothetical protein
MTLIEVRVLSEEESMVLFAHRFAGAILRHPKRDSMLGPFSITFPFLRGREEEIE